MDFCPKKSPEGYHAGFQHDGLTGLLNFPAFYQCLGWKICRMCWGCFSGVSIDLELPLNH